MDPFITGVFGKGVEGPPPLIRIVFALASEECGVYVPLRADGSSPRRKLAKADASKFTAYEIWFAGATRQTFGVIQNEGEEQSVQGLLRTVRDQRDIFKMSKYGQSREEIQNTIRSMQPLVSAEQGQFMNFITDDDVHAPVDLALSEEDEL